MKVFKRFNHEQTYSRYNINTKKTSIVPDFWQPYEKTQLFPGHKTISSFLKRRTYTQHSVNKAYPRNERDAYEKHAVKDGLNFPGRS